MELRSVADRDSDDVREVVRRSFRASYSLSPATIDAILEEHFAPDALCRRGSRSETPALVAERDGTVVGFAEGRVRDGIGELRWLHVAPPARGTGVGTRLFEDLTERLREADVDEVRVRLLAENSEGEEFVERFGFSAVDHATLDVGGEELAERVYAPDAETTDPDVPETTTVDGETLTLDRDDPVPGVDAAFFPARRDGTRYGFYCANCGAFVEAMDELERIRCGTCGNTHRPDEWDEAYL